MPMPENSPPSSVEWNLDWWVYMGVPTPEEPYYWEISYRSQQLEGGYFYGIGFTLHREAPNGLGNIDIGDWMWTGASLVEIVDQITRSSSGSSDDLAAEEFEWLPSEEIIRTVPLLDAQHTALLYSWSWSWSGPDHESLLAAIEVCEELQRQEVALEPHHETMLTEAVFANGSPPREAVEMIASLRRAEGLD